MLPVLPGLVNGDYGDYFAKDRRKKWKTYLQNKKH